MNTQIMEHIIAEIFKQKILKKEDTAIICYNLDGIDRQICELHNAFPPDTLHAVAIKANPLHTILKRLVAAGNGLEAASLPEVYMALEAGAAPNKIVFDSPAKTKEELKFALEKGIHINADSFKELDRINELLKTVKSESEIGLRINPQIGQGKIKSTSVSGLISKFGVPINNNRIKISL